MPAVFELIEIESGNVVIVADNAYRSVRTDNNALTY